LVLIIEYVYRGEIVKVGKTFKIPNAGKKNPQARLPAGVHCLQRKILVYNMLDAGTRSCCYTETILI
jgi:hypothetical protein